MILYDLRLALLSIRRTPGLTALMVTAVAFGIAACSVMITAYHAQSGNPIWWKNDHLYAVTLDAKGLRFSTGTFHFADPPPQLTQADALAIYRSAIPAHKVMMYKARGTLTGDVPGIKPLNAAVRITTADFFGMFDVPFRFGSGWNAGSDTGPGAVAVLSKRANDRLFAGTNTVGTSVTLNGHAFRVIGVLDEWTPSPKFYDLNNGAFIPGEDVFLPFGWGEALEMFSSGNTNCMSPEAIDKLGSYRSLMTADCVWLQFWVELNDNGQLQQLRQYMDSYVVDQKKLGRFPRPLNNRLLNVQQWLQFNDVVSPSTRIELVLAFLFLGLCLLNTIGLLLAKFIGASALVGIRRALGARRADIVRQHLVEVLVIGLLGGGIGLLLARLALAAQSARLLSFVDDADMRAILRSLAHMDTHVIAATTALALLTTVLAGLYPAWRVGRTVPARYLKDQ